MSSGSQWRNRPKKSNDHKMEAMIWTCSWSL